MKTLPPKPDTPSQLRSWCASRARPAWAQTYPSKPIRCIVPSSPGGGADTTARLVAAALPAVLGEQVVVENRAGASGNIGTAAAAKSPP
jgi:tripartite-type tricarboxylate transporter receptor subunit TctC